jgi:hypothetical protein
VWAVFCSYIHGIKLLSMDLRLRCVKGIADKTNIICLVNDVVRIVIVDEGLITVVGEKGWCQGMELEFSTIEIAEQFEVFFG